jgi:predicted DNA-binding transcriptional regulator AlpA
MDLVAAGGDVGGRRAGAAVKQLMDELDNNVNALLLSAKDAGRLLGIGERFVWAMHSSGELGPLPIRLGKRTLWSRIELTEWVRARCPRREAWLAHIGDVA